jgi:GTPase involved in cell partitioning and DNA repair
MFSVRSATEATLGHLEIAKETATGQDRTKRKVMLEMFFGLCGTDHMKFIPEGATVKKHSYKEILSRLRNSIRRVLSFGAGGTGCCYTTLSLYISPYLSKRS